MKAIKLIRCGLFPLMLAGLLNSVMTLPAEAQDDIQPGSPQLDIVTVDPATGFAVLKWLPSSSPDVGSYVVYTWSGTAATAVDTIRSPYIYEYTHSGSAARYRSVTYMVAAIDSSLNISPLSNGLSTIWLSAVNDVCNSRVTVTWTPFENLRHPATGYVMHISEGDGAVISDVNLPPGETQYLFSGYNPDTEYCFNVTAAGGEGPVSSSNRACITTGSEVAPVWVRIDAVEVRGGGIIVTAGYDPATVLENYRLLVYNPGTVTWDEAEASTGSSGRVLFTLLPADTTVSGLYRVAAVNSCGVNVTLSASARNMVLESSFSGTLINLRWNRPVSSGSEVFSVWRDTGNGLIEVATGLTDTLWAEDYTVFAPDVTSGKVVYRVTAADPDAPSGSPLHLSSAAVIEVDENVFIPNAFTPSGTGENAVFRPEFSFIPGAYDFRIMSRNGVLLYRTGDPGEGWDGRHSGKPMPAGVYLWSLRLTTPSGSSLSRTGTVTILP